MNLPATVLRKMMDKGLSLADVVEIAEAWEEGASLPMPAPIDVSAERRRAKDRERKKVVRGMSAEMSAECPQTGQERVSPTPPSERTPSPPLKGGISPVEASQPAKPIENSKPLSAWVGEIWQSAPRPGRERSGRRDLENALKTAQRKGADLEAVAAGVAAYYASPDATKNGGEYAKGVHVVVSSGRWEAFAPEEPSAAADPPASDENEWSSRIRRFVANAYWNDRDWGPKPGKPGCLIPAETLMAAGFIPPPKAEIAA